MSEIEIKPVKAWASLQYGKIDPLAVFRTLAETPSAIHGSIIEVLISPIKPLEASGEEKPKPESLIQRSLRHKNEEIDKLKAEIRELKWLKR